MGNNLGSKSLCFIVARYRGLIYRCKYLHSGITPINNIEISLWVYGYMLWFQKLAITTSFRSNNRHQRTVGKKLLNPRVACSIYYVKVIIFVYSNTLLRN